ncbi:hypothetical protein [Clostridium sp. CAG:265]|uniref:hypothetical protein n=1 Tax=Clostridium sp. CAG:265 TaxID=1262787 RepID=UPI0003362E33|nr:hypothetical protein [Clostridium sp. CAG:265]CDB75809.1 unknown [Clostridium sp. CAG:265]
MKKKFLSLMMAAAVVATTSVSAFAEVVRDNVTYPDSANVITSDKQETTSNVTINGNIQDEKGNDAPSTFKVTVPTAASFTVNKAGSLVGPTLTVKNEGKQEVEVYAQSFSAGDGNIQVISEDTIKTDTAKESATLDRSSVSLKLTGNSGQTAYLGAATGIRAGVYGQPGLNAEQISQDGILLTTLAGGSEETPSTQTIRMEGSAGKNTVPKAVSDTFTLTLKIKKVVKA